MGLTKFTGSTQMDGSEDSLFKIVGTTMKHFATYVYLKALQAGESVRLRVYNKVDDVSHWKLDGDVLDSIASNNGTITYHANLKRLYKFDNNLNDSTTAAANGTLTAGTANYVTGQEGNAFSFDGASYINASDTGLPSGNTARSISCWVKFTSFTQFASFIGYGTQVINQYFTIYPSSTASTSTLTIDPYGGGGITSVTALQLNTWYFITITYDGTTLRLYINGVNDASGTPAALNTTLAGASGVQLGKRIDAATYHNGLLDEVRFYSVSLSQAQVSALYMVGKIGQSHTFDNGEYISTGNPTALQFERTNSFTLYYWAKYTTNAKEKVLTKNNGDATTGYEAGFNASGFPILRLINTASTNEINVVGSASYADGAYHLFVWSYSGTSLASGVILYVDGVAVSLTVTTNNLSATITNANNVTFGADGTGTNPFTGQLDDIRIYNRVLSAAEVSDLFKYPESAMKSLVYDKTYSGPVTDSKFVPFLPGNQYMVTALQTGGTNRIVNWEREEVS